MTHPIYGVSDFVAVCNQVLDVSFGLVAVVGELANFRISKNRWVYFDLKDDFSSVRFFCSVYMLPGPLEEGMMLVVAGNPALHPRFGFSITAQSIQLQGEGAIKKAANLLEAKLEKEGLFGEDRKRILPSMPESVGLVTSLESAAYGDFTKIITARWGIRLSVYDVQVQGNEATGQIVRAIDYFSRMAKPPEVLVIIRGGGSADDLQVFSTEQVTRAVAGSRIPTLVAIGHERDISLAEKAADMRASTPSNAAELLVPDRTDELRRTKHILASARQSVAGIIDVESVNIVKNKSYLSDLLTGKFSTFERTLDEYTQRTELLNPDNVLKRGYAIVRSGNNKIVTSSKDLKAEQDISIHFKDGKKSAKIV